MKREKGVRPTGEGGKRDFGKYARASWGAA
jgi:hypothetical protein